MLVLQDLGLLNIDCYKIQMLVNFSLFMVYYLLILDKQLKHLLILLYVSTILRVCGTIELKDLDESPRDNLYL